MAAQLVGLEPEPPVSISMRVRAAVEAVAALQACLDEPAVAVAGDDVRAIERLARRVDAVRLAAVAAVDAAEVGGGAGMSGTSAWLAKATQVDGAAAAGQVRMARALDQGLPATREALVAGEVSTEHVRVISRAVEQLPEDLTAGERARVEAHLVAQARTVDPARLRRTARRALAALDRSVVEVDSHHGAVLRSEEEQALAATRFTMHDNGDGTSSGQFTVPSLAAAILRKTLEQLTSPRRMIAHERGGVDGRATGIAWAHAQGLALAELLEHLPTDRLSSKVAATVVVTLDLDRLRAGLGAAGLDVGSEISAGEARRLACSAGILPAVLGGGSLPLDLGRASRLFTETQRVALATVYDTCAAQGCDRPYAWSELHHEHSWSHGGGTDLADAVPACGFHHRRIHDPAYHHRIVTDDRGKKTITFIRRT